MRTARFDGNMTLMGIARHFDVRVPVHYRVNGPGHQHNIHRQLVQRLLDALRRPDSELPVSTLVRCTLSCVAAA